MKWSLVFIFPPLFCTKAQVTDNAWENLQLSRSQGSSIASSISSLDIGPLDSIGTASIAKNFTSEEITSENVTAQLGSSVFLDCKTHHSMERQVSWVRRKDWHILTFGTKPYTNEERFVVHHQEGSTDWVLEIKYVELEDDGTYECQIATGAGILSHLVHLSIVAPRAVIPGNGEYHVETGSTITLDCIIEQSPVAPQFIFWYHNDRMINYDADRGTVYIDLGPPKIRSRLSVKDARPSDSGNYTCTAASTLSASIMVYITEANNIAVIQTRTMDQGTALRPPISHVIFNVLMYLTLYFAQLLIQGTLPCALRGVPLLGESYFSFQT